MALYKFRIIIIIINVSSRVKSSLMEFGPIQRISQFCASRKVIDVTN